MSGNFLEIKNMKKTFGELEVIKDISLSVKDGDVPVCELHAGGGKGRAVLQSLRL